MITGLSNGQFGFMDCVGVSGDNLFMSLLFIEGARGMAAALGQAGCPALTVPLANYTAEAQRTSDAIGLLFDDSIGMYLLRPTHNKCIYPESGVD